MLWILYIAGIAVTDSVCAKIADRRYGELEKNGLPVGKTFAPLTGGDRILMSLFWPVTWVIVKVWNRIPDFMNGI